MAEIRFLGRLELRDWIEQAHKLGVDRSDNERMSRTYEIQIAELVNQRKFAVGMMIYRHLDGEIWRLERRKSGLADEWFRGNSSLIALVDKGDNQLERQQINAAFKAGAAGEPLELIP